jgi:hypothetical protein
MTNQGRAAWIAVILVCLVGALALGAQSHVAYSLIFAVIGGAAAARLVADA